VSKGYFDTQNEPGFIQWPAGTWFQERRKSLVVRKEMAGLLAENNVDHKYDADYELAMSSGERTGHNAWYCNCGHTSEAEHDGEDRFCSGQGNGDRSGH
jgi:hypothetical protein